MKQTHLIIFTLICSLALLVLFPLNSYSLDERLYSFNFKFGGYTPTGNLSEVEEQFGANYNSGPNLEISFAHRIIPHFGLEYSAGLLNTKLNDSTFGSYKYNSDITAPYLLITALGLYQFKRVELYGGGGLGYYLVSGTFERKQPSGFQDTIEGNDAVNGQHLTAGLKFNITKTFYVGFEGRYVLSDQAEISNEIGSFYPELEGYTLFFALGFKFD